MGRPRKVKPEGEKETLLNSPLIKEVIFRKPVIVDPRFGHSSPAPKPSQMKKGRDKKEDSDN